MIQQAQGLELRRRFLASPIKRKVGDRPDATRRGASRDVDRFLFANELGRLLGRAATFISSERAHECGRAVSFMADPAKRDQDKIESCLEKTRQQLFDTLDALRAGTLSDKEADAVAAAIEDELIALRVSLLRGR